MLAARIDPNRRRSGLVAAPTALTYHGRNRRSARTPPAAGRATSGSCAVCRNTSARQWDTDPSRCDPSSRVLRVNAQTGNMDADRCRAAVVSRPQHGGPGRRHARYAVTACDAVPAGPGVSRPAPDLTPPPGLWYGAVPPGLVRTCRLVDAGRLPPCNAGRATAEGFYPRPAHRGAGWPGQARHQPSVQRSGTAPAPAPPGAPPGNSVPSLPASTSPRRQKPGRGA